MKTDGETAAWITIYEEIASVDLLTAQVNRLTMTPERRAPVLVRARGRPSLSGVEKKRRRLAIEEGKAARKADKELARQNKRKNS